MWSCGTRSSTKVCELALGEVERRVDALAAALEPPLVAHRARDRPFERERQVRRAEQHAVRVHLDLVLGAPVVEARLDLDLEAHLAAHDDDAAEQAMAVQRPSRRGRSA